MAVDHFAAEPLIIARLQALNIPTVRTIGSASLLAGLKNITPLLPGIFVMPGAGQMSRGADGRLQTETQYWQMAVCLAHVKDPADANTTASRAGAIARQALASLVGWSPSAAFRPMELVDRPDPYYDTGYAEFPFVLQTQFDVEGA